MNSINKFFIKLYTHPGLIWKAGAGFLFIVFALVVYFHPTLATGVDISTRRLLCGLLLAYGLFRFVTFYMDYKNMDNE